MTDRRRSTIAFALCVIVTAVACLSLAAQEPELMRDPKTRELFASARIAIFGGPGGIARLRALRFKGRSRFAGTAGDLLSAAVFSRIAPLALVVRSSAGS